MLDVSAIAELTVAQPGLQGGSGDGNLIQVVQQDEAAHLRALGDQPGQVARAGHGLSVIVSRDGAAQDDSAEARDVGDPGLEGFTADIIEEEVDPVGRKGTSRAATSSCR